MRSAAVYDVAFPDPIVGSPYGPEQVVTVVAFGIDAAIQTALDVLNRPAPGVGGVPTKLRTREEIKSVNMVYGLVWLAEEVTSANADE